MEELKQYIISNKVSTSKLTAETCDSENNSLPQRHLFVKLKQYTDGFIFNGEQPRFIALSGLRGVGKTTLMWQVAKHIFNNRTKEIYFINADDLSRLGFSLYDAFNVLEKDILQKPFHELQKPIVLLIDEVHEVSNWDKDLKIFYERCKLALILCTGSSALLLHQSPDLASRWSLIRLYPFRFSEFIHAKSWMINPKKQLFAQKGLGSNMKQTLLYSKDIKELEKGIKQNKQNIIDYLENIKSSFNTDTLNDLINEYISYHNIARFLTIKNKSLINDRIIDLFERILIKDIPGFAKVDINEASLMFRLLMRLALSEEINLVKLAGTLGCSQQQVEHFIETLNKAEVLNILNPYGSIKVKTGQLKKIFFMSPSLRRALYQRVYGDKIENKLRAKLYEDIVAMYLKRVLQEPGLLSFGISQEGVSPDFVVETLDAPIVIEVGSQKSTARQTEKYISCKRYGIIINASDTDYSIRDNTLIMPLSWFLLL